MRGRAGVHQRARWSDLWGGEKGPAMNRAFNLICGAHFELVCLALYISMILIIPALVLT